jgi:O-antigen ligase
MVHPVPRTRQIAVLSEGLTAALGIAYIAVLFIAGFLTNFVPLGTVNTGTLVLYSLASALSFVGFLYLFGPQTKLTAKAATITIFVSLLMVVKAGLDSNPMNQRILEIAIFFLGAWPVLFFIQINSGHVRQRLTNTMSIGLFGLSAFAIFQSIFASSLPLSMFALRGDSTFVVEGGEILRPTGLTGNPIIFSGILVLASAYFAAFWLEKRKSKYLLALICSLVANYLTYTRASFILVIPVLICVWLFHNRFRIKHKFVTVAGLILIAASGPFLLALGANLIIIQRLQNSDASSYGSTLEHFEQIGNSISAILAHPFAGKGMGSQGDFVGAENVIITDGAWWIFLLEFGIPLATLILCLLSVVLIPIVRFTMQKRSHDRALEIATLSFFAYIVPANFINSALLGHISFGLFWVVLGLSIADTSQAPALNSEQNLIAVQNPA